MCRARRENSAVARWRNKARSCIFSSLFFLFSFTSFFLWYALELRASCSSISPRLGAGAAEEFQVGDTCNASAAQKQLREVILYFAATASAVLVDFRFGQKYFPRAKLIVQFREPLSYDEVFRKECGNCTLNRGHVPVRSSLAPRANNHRAWFIQREKIL